ncbi:MAG: hypothetical protein KJN62_08780, partial [Deltaproteobacteria bacterium]|nr:hypothetical protein [Deltaproteobacteria bacterium]
MNQENFKDDQRKNEPVGNPEVTDEGVISPDIPVEKSSRLARTIERFSVIFSSKIAMIGLAIVLFWVFVAIFAPALTSFTPYEQDWRAPNQGPSTVHILGTDELGRDLWSRLIYGARVVLVVLPVSENVYLPGGTALWG